MKVKTLILTAAFLGAGVLGAAAQSSPSPSPSPTTPSSPMQSPSTSPSSPASPNTSANVSATTHCKTANGQVQLKASTTGSPPPSSAPITGVSPSVIATLPNC